MWVSHRPVDNCIAYSQYLSTVLREKTNTGAGQEIGHNGMLVDITSMDATCAGAKPVEKLKIRSAASYKPPEEDKMDVVMFYREHTVDGLPHGVTDGFTACPCGGRWRAYYTRHGLVRVALNDEAQRHDAEFDALPHCACGGALGWDGHAVFCTNPAPETKCSY
jgi:hypothetical protein